MRIILVTTNAEMEEHKRIAEEAIALGHEFLVVDLKNFDFSIIDGQIKVPGYDPREGDVIIPRAIFKSLHAIVALIGHYQMKGVKVFDNHLLHHKYSINKQTDFIKLGSAGVPMPKTYHVSSFDQYEEAVENVGYPAIIKLTKTGKGKGIYKVENREELQAFIAEREAEAVIPAGEDEPKNQAERYIIQEFFPYVHDLRVLIIGENVHCMKRIPGDGEFRANFSLGGSVELFPIEDKDIELARKALDAVNLDLGGVDLLIAEDGRRIILEANHTPGMLGMEQATGKNITREYLEYAIRHAK